MADTPVPVLAFDAAACGDCAARAAVLPGALPHAGDDFNWRACDYDALRQFMLEELVARFPERRRWTAADMEVVIIEALAAQLDQFSDAADKVALEGMLETARQPQSVRRLLAFIGFDAYADARAEGQIAADADGLPALGQWARLETFWQGNGHAMAAAKARGVARLFDQNRMVAIADYAARMDDHPLAARVNARSRWNGSWDVVSVAVILANTAWRLDQSFGVLPPPSGVAELRAFNRRIAKLKSAIDAAHLSVGARLPAWSEDPSFRRILRAYVEALRLAGQPVTLEDAVPAGIAIVASLSLAPGYYQSEVRRAAEAALGSGPGGMFHAGALRFGEDLFASDVIARLMNLAGVANVCLIRFKRVGLDYPDESGTGRIQLDGLEVAVCDNDPANRARGYLSFRLNGGRRG